MEPFEVERILGNNDESLAKCSGGGAKDERREYPILTRNRKSRLNTYPLYTVKRYLLCD